MLLKFHSGTYLPITSERNFYYSTDYSYYGGSSGILTEFKIYPQGKFTYLSKSYNSTSESHGALSGAEGSTKHQLEGRYTCVGDHLV